MTPQRLLLLLLGATSALALSGRHPLAPGMHHRFTREVPHLLLDHTSAPLTNTPLHPGISRVVAAATQSTRAGAFFPSFNLTSASALIRVPVPLMPTSGPTAGNTAALYGASFWAGLDAVSSATTCNGSLRAGFDMYWNAGVQQVVPWTQWWPATAVSLASNFTTAPGDLLRLSVHVDEASDGTAGTAVFENFGAGNATVVPLQSALWSFWAQTAHPLCRTQAGWVIDDNPQRGGASSPVALVNWTDPAVFGELDVRAWEGVRQRVDVSAATSRLMDINLAAQGGRLTNCAGGDRNLNCARIVGGA